MQNGGGFAFDTYTAAKEAMRLLNDADFAESNHFFKATRLFIAQAAQQGAHAAELTKVRSVVPPRSLVITP